MRWLRGKCITDEGSRTRHTHTPLEGDTRLEVLVGRNFRHLHNQRSAEHIKTWGNSMLFTKRLFHLCPRVQQQGCGLCFSSNLDPPYARTASYFPLCSAPACAIAEKAMRRYMDLRSVEKLRRPRICWSTIDPQFGGRAIGIRASLLPVRPSSEVGFQGPSLPSKHRRPALWSQGRLVRPGKESSTTAQHLVLLLPWCVVFAH